MGLLHDQVLGEISGKVGEIIYRNRPGKKNVAYKIPEFTNINYSPASVDNRNRFKPMTQFASMVWSLPELKSIWDKHTRFKAKAAYHKIEQANARLFAPLHPTVNNIIVPSGFSLELNSAVANKDKVSVSVSLNKLLYHDINQIKSFNVIMMLCFFNPTNNEYLYYNFNRIRIYLSNWEYDKPVEITYNYLEDEGILFSMYHKCILYFTLIAQNAEKSYLANSANKSIGFDIPHPG